MSQKERDQIAARLYGAKSFEDLDNDQKVVADSMHSQYAENVRYANKNGLPKQNIDTFTQNQLNNSRQWHNTRLHKMRGPNKGRRALAQAGQNKRKDANTDTEDKAESHSTSSHGAKSAMKAATHIPVAMAKRSVILFAAAPVIFLFVVMIFLLVLVNVDSDWGSGRSPLSSPGREETIDLDTINKTEEIIASRNANPSDTIADVTNNPGNLLVTCGGMDEYGCLNRAKHQLYWYPGPPEGYYLTNGMAYYVFQSHADGIYAMTWKLEKWQRGSMNIHGFDENTSLEDTIDKWTWGHFNSSHESKLSDYGYNKDTTLWEADTCNVVRTIAHVEWYSRDIGSCPSLTEDDLILDSDD